MKLGLLLLLAATSVSAFTPRSAAFRLKSSALNVVTNSAPGSTKTKAPVFDEVCETTGVTLKRFMSEVAMLNPELTELTVLFGAIDTACKAIVRAFCVLGESVSRRATFLTSFLTLVPNLFSLCLNIENVLL